MGRGTKERVHGSSVAAAVSCGSRREMIPRTGKAMERPIDQIRRAEEAMRELLKAAAQLRQQVENAGNPQQLAELIKAAAEFEKEAQKIKESLQQWRQSIQ